MDQTQWNALNQMLSRQPKGGQVNTGKTSAASAGRPMQGTVQTRVISASSAMAQQRGSRQQLNGAQQETAVGGGVVKSLLTGRQYAQSVLRPDVGRGQVKTAAKNAPKQQVSLLQPQWQQQVQQTVDTSAVGETQQIMLSGLPENIGPGETLYVVVDGVTYQIDSSNAEQLLAAAASGNIATGAGGASVLPVGSRISLEDLANISAEQQTLSIDYQSSGDMTAVSASDVKLEMQAVASSGSDTAANIGVHQIDGQQFFDAQGAATMASGNGSEQMQIIILPAEGGDMKGGDFKVGGQDFILQSGQQLPPELQEMVARGLPIDFSNYEFVIQDEDGNVGQDGSGATTYLSAGQSLAGGTDNSSVIVSLSGTGGAGGTNEDILGMLAEASSHQGQGIQQWNLSGTGSTSAVQITEEDDGEFAYVVGAVDEPGDLGSVGPMRQIQESGFLTAFADFLSGAKAETLSSVANSTVVRKPPQLPIAYVPEPSRKSGSSSHEDKTKSPMTIVLTESATGQQVVYVNESGTPVSGRGRGRGRGRPPNRYIVQRYPGTSGTPQKGEDADKSATSMPTTKEQIRQSIIAKSKFWLKNNLLNE